MKSLKDYSLNIPEQEYHDYSAWSYSTIAKYAKNGFDAIATLHDKFEPTPAMRFGSLFDSIITRGKDTLNYYTVSSVSVPDAERKTLEYIASKTKEPLDELKPNFISTCCDEIGYQTRWGFDARFKHLVLFKDYYDKLRSGKEIVSEEDWSDAVKMANILKNYPNTKDIFKTGEKDGVEYIYQPQYVVEWDIENERVKVKCMLDLVIVDHNNKTIQPIDLKTSQMPAHSWSENFLKLRYDLQAELYTDVLRKVCQETATEYADYIILPYIFADISRSDMVPVTYSYDPTNGFSFSKGDKVYQYKGWKELLAEILVYEANNAVVPMGISIEEPNDIIEILSR